MAEIAAGSRQLELAGLMTHFATADEPGDTFFAPAAPALQGMARHRAAGARARRQLGRACCAIPECHFDMVRPGVARLRHGPVRRDPDEHDLVPALTLRSRVGAVKAIAPGESAGYGRRFIAEHDDHARHDSDRLRRRHTAAP